MEALRKVNSANAAGLATSSGFGSMHDAAGVSLDLGFPWRRAQRVFLVGNTLTAGGVYTGTITYLVCRGTSTATTISTTNLCTVNSHQYVELWNLAEIGTDFHFTGTNAFVAAFPSPGYDSLQTAAVWLFNSPLPPQVQVNVSVAGGSNGTAPSGAMATFNSYTYNFSYNNTTLGTAQVPKWGPRIAGIVNQATYGWAQLNTGTVGTVTYTLTSVWETVGGPACN